jgi:hypothetical protein
MITSGFLIAVIIVRKGRSLWMVDYLNKGSHWEKTVPKATLSVPIESVLFPRHQQAVV